MASRKSPARKPSRAAKTHQPRRKKKKPSRIRRWLRALKNALKRTTVRIFIGITFVSATFPAMTESVQEQISMWADRAVNTQQIQSLMALPVLGDLLQRVDAPAARPTQAPRPGRGKAVKKKNKRIDTIRNPLA